MAAAALCGFAPAAVSADVERLSRTPVDLLGYNAFGPDGAPVSIAAVGDVNGDGADDLAVGAPAADSRPAVVYLVHGGHRLVGLDLSGRRWSGFRITASTAIGSIVRVARAGDINGDGLADVLLGFPKATVDGRVEAGLAAVVYGKRTDADVDLDQLGPRGLTVVGARGSPRTGVPGDNLGASVSAAGDVNGDGRNDIVVTSPWAEDPYPARAHVVLGGGPPGRIDTQDLGDRGWQISNNESALGGVADAGDFNGDGLADVMIAEPGAAHSGRVSVVFGSADRDNVDLASMGGRGIRISAEPDLTGPGGRPRARSVGLGLDGAGDFNADGVSDVAIGAPGSFGGAGAAYVVYGSRGTGDIDLGELGDRGFELRGVLSTKAEHGSDRAMALGRDIAGGLDMNSDARPDLALGAPGTWTSAGPRSGRAYVLYAGQRYESMTTATLPRSALRIESRGPDELGGVLTGGGDLTGNGRQELVFATSRGRIRAAEAQALRLRSRERRVARKSVTLPLTCARAETRCRGTLVLALTPQRGARRAVSVGRVRVDLRAGARATVSIKLTARGRRIVRSRRVTPAVLTARLNGFSQSQSLRVHRPGT